MVVCQSYIVFFFKGSKVDRAKNSIRTIGPAVLNGGTTTFLAVITLTGSQSHMFIAFWKIFCLTVIFGLFYGIITLPVVLCYLGTNKKKEEESNKSEEQGEVNKGMENEVSTEIS